MFINKQKSPIKKWNIENIVLIVIKHLKINQISALHDPYGVDIPLNK